MGRDDRQRSPRPRQRRSPSPSRERNVGYTRRDQHKRQRRRTDSPQRRERARHRSPGRHRHRNGHNAHHDVNPRDHRRDHSRDRSRSQSRTRCRSRSRDREAQKNAVGWEGERRRREYADAVSTGLDADADHAEPYEREERSCNVLVVEGLPTEAQIADVRALFAAVPGVVGLRLEKKPGSEAQCTGTAYLELFNLAAAEALMATAWRDSAHFGQHRLRLSYFDARSAAPSVIQRHCDWGCPSCREVNYARRDECRSCKRPRTAAAEIVEPNTPSMVVRIDNLHQLSDSAALEVAIKALCPLKRLRFARRRDTGEPTGTAYAHFYSLADAATVMEQLDGAHAPGSDDRRMRLCYTLDKLEDAGAMVEEREPDRAAEALEAVGWEPVTFDESAMEAGTVENTAGVGAEFVDGGAAADAAVQPRPEDVGVLESPAVVAPAPAFPKPELRSLTGATLGAGVETRSRMLGEEPATGGIETPGTVYNAAGINATISAGPQLKPQALMEAARGVAVPSAHHGMMCTGSTVPHAQKAEMPGATGTATAAPGKVRGVVHRGKWAQRALAKQGQQT